MKTELFSVTIDFDPVGGIYLMAFEGWGIPLTAIDGDFRELRGETSPEAIKAQWDAHDETEKLFEGARAKERTAFETSLRTLEEIVMVHALGSSEGVVWCE